MKKNKIAKIAGVAAALSGIATIASCSKLHDYTIVKDYLIEMPTYKSIDYNYAQSWFKTHPFGAGGCSAVVKDVAQTNEDPHLIVGRNMDYGFSKKCAYIIRTAEPNKLKTLGFAYATNKTSPDFDDLKWHGISDEWYRIMPFFCTDIINEKGLYCEIDMRNIERDPSTGKSIFRCEGTNPSTGVDVHMVALTRFIAANCEDVESAVKYVKQNINVFNNENDWNFSFMLADAKGNYGLLEFGYDKVWFEPGVKCQTNYFLNGDPGKNCKNKFGIGRREYLLNHLDEVTDGWSMFNLINQLSYSNVYKGKYCPFDMRSETSDFMPFDEIEYEWLMPDYTEEDHPTEVKKVYSIINDKLKELWKLSEEERRKLSWYWQSTFTEVIDIPTKTIHIRMFEDNNYVFDFKL